MIRVTVSEAEARLFELIKLAHDGEEVVITAEGDQTPVARLEVIEPAEGGQRLGFRETPGFVLQNSFWEPLPEDELRLWNGEGE